MFETDRGKFSYTTKDTEEIPKISEEIKSEDWNNFDGQMTYFCINNYPFISSTDKTGPLAIMDDGFSDLVVVKGNNIGLCKMANIMLKTDGSWEKNGQIDQSLGMDYHKIKAFRLEPEGGLFSIDGERYETKKI
eukprot:CAMPEP_0114591484 /NCGR_PEP_ID=MMETSP0125-20121206/13521_1 /TAXON_ID=485358 ORGANISM="Aristerostoma sp., Strain ATCC 50986" /NCGR_SAMPLE_ID=MMETSP0125 /ASSEMBLY_ACC=CAM_ASM_000245 /LENGTH=133 /DNA_ID=CAMNT_0001789595 /DNA_START=1056 /DNA_END=1458 /DNA_ORIENTATION=-